MSDDQDDPAEVLIDFETTVRLLRIIDNVVMPVRMRLRAEVLPGNAENLTDEVVDVGFAKVRFWLDNVLHRCIAFVRGNETARDMLLDAESRNRSGNMLMLCPGEPVDEHLAALLQAKMTALSGGAVRFGAIEVQNEGPTGLIFTFAGNAREMLPLMEEWVGPRSYFAEPWWHRDDASTIDVIPADDADLSQQPAWAYSLDFVAQAVRPAKETVIRPNFPRFEPKIIDGGKKDE